MKTNHPIEQLIQIMAHLRSANGCPWDREQNFTSLIPHTLEEAYEVAETIDQKDFMALREELGDLLFQIVFYAQLATEQGVFDFSQVVETIVDKLVRRHPHVFGNEPVGNAVALSRAWEQYKAQERAARGVCTNSLMDGVSHGLPSLARAMKLQRRAAQVGFDWQEADAVLDKFTEETVEFRQAQAENDPERLSDDLGDILFTCVNMARHYRLDPETVLRKANTRFEHRFRLMEGLAATQGTELSKLDLERMNSLWEQVKELS